MPRREDRSIGVSYPIQRSSDGYFDKTFTSIEELKANIINVLSTRRGERIMKPDFGSDLHQIIFEQATSRIEQRVESEINRVIDEWVPQIDVSETNVSRVDEDNALLVDITFTTPFLPEGEDETIEMFFSL